jgi:methyl-accepting chemotaxis protein
MEAMWGNLSISKKIGVCLGVVILVMISMAVTTQFAMSTIEAKFSSLIDNEAALVGRGNLAKISLLQCRRNEKDTLYNDDASLVQTVNDFAGKMREDGRIIRALAERTGDASLIDEAVAFLNAADDYQRLFQKSVASPMGQERMVSAIPMRKAATEAEKRLNQLMDIVDRRVVSVKAETLRQAAFAQKIAVAIGIVAIALGGFFVVVLTRSITRPLSALVGSVSEVSAGKTDVVVPATDRKDEIGPLAQALDRWRTGVIEARQEEAARQEEVARREVRQHKMEAATQRFDATVIAMLEKIKAAVGYLHNSANTLSANAEQTQRQSAAVSAATDQATANVETVSAAGTELMASIQEISRQVQRSATTAQAASAEAEATNRKIGGLAEAAQKIGEVVSMINSIASQTNLLALNATIESARAGDAGKGFAVVAHEVKNLAGQTGRATEDIAAQISSVQVETLAAVTAIEGISQTIDRINEMATAIAGAVEEQGAATAEIARNVEQASIGTREVAANIADVAQAAAETGRMSQSVFQAANGLLAESETLEREVERFLSEVRVA